MLPKGYYPEDVEEEASVPPSPRRPRPRSLLWRLVPVAAVAAALAGFAGLLLAAYFTGDRAGGGPTPLIRADATPAKIRPENPGGLEVPNQDIDILDRPRSGSIGGQDAAAPRIERLLPPPETPLPRPSAAPPVLQPVIPAAPVIAPPPDAIEVPRIAIAPPPVSTQRQPAPAPQAQPQPRLTIPPQLAAPGATGGPPAPAGQILLRPPGRGGAVTAAPPADSPGALPADLPGFRVQLGIARTADDAQREWQRLRDNNADLLGRLSATIVPSGRGAGASHRIHAGPLLTESGAGGLCRRLAGRGIGCSVVRR